MSVYKKYNRMNYLALLGHEFTGCNRCQEQYAVVFPVCPFCRSGNGKPANEGTGNCNICEFHKAMSNKKKGVKIPNSYGKCIRPGGHCDPDTVNTGIERR